MRKHQLIQLLQFIIARVWVALFVIFVVKESFVDFVLKYWLYLLIVSISYFYYYSIQYELDKKYEHIRNTIIYGNVYLFAHIFFRPLLNISHSLFILLWLIILWLWWISRLKTRWKIVWQILWIIVSFFILISWIFYLYPDKPDIEWFINTKPYKISVFGLSWNVEKMDAYIQIINKKRTDDYILDLNFEKILTEDCKISYPSLKMDRDEKVIIQTPQWDLYLLYPQSEIQLEFSWKNLVKMSKLNWRIGFFSGLFNSSIINDFESENIYVEWNDWVNTQQNLYKYDLVYYLKNQISENNMGLVNNTIMYNIDWIILKYLARIFPASYTKNLNNYNEFQKYFEFIPKEKIKLNRYSNKKNSDLDWVSIWNSMMKGMNAWLKTTRLFH